MSEHDKTPRSGDALDAAIDAAAALAGVTVTTEQRPNVRLHLETGLRIAQGIGAQDIGAQGVDRVGREAAPVFRP